MAAFYQDSGLKPLNPTWAKLEILLGLAAIGVSLFYAREMMETLEPLFGFGGKLSPLVLFVLGSYLTMAGQRSHLYQSNNRLVAYLAVVIRSQHSDGDRS